VSRANVEVVRSIYAAWLAGNSAAEWIDEDVEYVNPPDAIEPGTRRGRAAFRGIRDAYDDLRIEPREFLEAGGDVVVIAKLYATGRGSGVPIEWDHGYIWTIEDGRAIRFRWFNNPAQALAAAGIAR
jgi:ketosteroid isomerase-like protein